MNINIRTKYSNRQSGIEFLKVIAIFIIMITHLTQSWLKYTDIQFTVTNMNANLFILLIFRHLGDIGNLIFFVCSAWFIVDSNKSKKQKIIQMIADVLTISVLWLLVPMITRVPFLNVKLIIKSLLPITFENNWYITCYILFYLASPFINKIINGIDGKIHFRIVLVLSFLYLFVNSIIGDRYYISSLIVFIVVYFIV